MDLWEDGLAAAATFEPGDDGDLSRDAGDHFGGLVSTAIGGATGLGSPALEGAAGSTELGDLYPLHLPGASHTVAGASSPPRLVRPPPGAEHVNGVGARAHPASAFEPPPAGGADPRMREGDRVGGGVVRDIPANFRLAAAGDGDLVGGVMRLPQAAVLAMTLGAMAIIGEPDAPWPNLLGALLAWLGGCIALFLSWN